MAFTARQMFADWYTKAEKKADESILKKRIEAIDTIISEKTEIGFWLDVLKLALGIKISTSQTFIEFFKTADFAFPVRNNDNISKVLANAALCFKLENEDDEINDKLSFAILISQAFEGKRFINDIPLVEYAKSHIQIRIIDERKIEYNSTDLDGLDSEASETDFSV